MPKLSKVARFEWHGLISTLFRRGKSAQLLRQAMVLGSAEIALVVLVLEEKPRTTPRTRTTTRVSFVGGPTICTLSKIG
jgi:hypothetical protein